QRRRVPQRAGPHHRGPQPRRLRRLPARPQRHPPRVLPTAEHGQVMSATISSGPNQTSAGAWRIVALLVAFSFMSWFNRVSMAVAYDTKIGPVHHVSEEAIGMVYSAFFLSYLTFMTPGGWFIDRFGAKRALLIMGLGSGLFGALTYFAGLPAFRAAWLLVMA